MQTQTFVAYYRVSTQKQGVTGLGLAAQKIAVQNYNIIAEFTEIESGKKNNRAELQKAIELCKQTGATLLIAKLDRLSRNASFIFALRDSGINFLCADMPEANTLTIGIMAVMAQHEREIISQRTKAALQAKKQRTGKIHDKTGNKGSMYLTDGCRQAGKQALKLKRLSNPNTKPAAALARSLKAAGFTLRKIAAELNSAGFKTATAAGFYTAIQVSRLLNFGV